MNTWMSSVEFLKKGYYIGGIDLTNVGLYGIISPVNAVKMN